MFHMYILKSEKNDKYYIGHTNDIHRRLEEHNSRHTKSTRAGIPWKIVFVEEYKTKHEAIIRENKIKSMKSKKFIKELINGVN